MKAAAERRRKKALQAARKLEAAADAINAYMNACRDCEDGTAVKTGNGIDGRNRLIRDMTEFASYLDTLYDKEPT